MPYPGGSKGVASQVVAAREFASLLNHRDTETQRLSDAGAQRYGGTERNQSGACPLNEFDELGVSALELHG